MLRFKEDHDKTSHRKLAQRLSGQKIYIAHSLFQETPANKPHLGLRSMPQLQDTGTAILAHHAPHGGVVLTSSRPPLACRNRDSSPSFTQAGSDKRSLDKEPGEESLAKGDTKKRASPSASKNAHGPPADSLQAAVAAAAYHRFTRSTAADLNKVERGGVKHPAENGAAAATALVAGGALQISTLRHSPLVRDGGAALARKQAGSDQSQGCSFVEPAAALAGAAAMVADATASEAAATATVADATATPGVTHLHATHMMAPLLSLQQPPPKLSQAVTSKPTGNADSAVQAGDDSKPALDGEDSHDHSVALSASVTRLTVNSRTPFPACTPSDFETDKRVAFANILAAVAAEVGSDTDEEMAVWALCDDVTLPQLDLFFQNTYPFLCAFYMANKKPAMHMILKKLIKV